MKKKTLVILVLFALLFTLSNTPIEVSAAAEDIPYVEEIAFTDGGASTIDSLEMTMPLNIHVDDLLMIIICSDNNADGTYFNPVGGWTKLEESGNVDVDCHIAVYWKIANGTEGNVVVTATDTNHILGWIIRIHGADSNDTIEASNFGASSAGGTQPQEIPSITTLQDNCLVLYGITFDGGDGYPMSVVSPFIELSDRTNTGTPNAAYCCGSFGYREFENAGPSGVAVVYTDESKDGATFFQVAINGDIVSTTATVETGILYDLFLSTSLWGYFGPLALVVGGFLLTKKEKNLGIFMIIVDSLVIFQYLTLIEATPDYWWHVIILLLGVIQCTIQLIDR